MTLPFGDKSMLAYFYTLYGKPLLFPQNLCYANLLREPCNLPPYGQTQITFVTPDYTLFNPIAP